jgi:hypothetical protein
MTRGDGSAIPGDFNQIAVRIAHVHRVYGAPSTGPFDRAVDDFDAEVVETGFDLGDRRLGEQTEVARSRGRVGGVGIEFGTGLVDVQ